MAELLAVPGLLWASILLVPFLPLATGQKAWAAFGLAAAAEGVFWTSALVFSLEVARRYRRLLDSRVWVCRLRERRENPLRR